MKTLLLVLILMIAPAVFAQTPDAYAATAIKIVKASWGTYDATAVAGEFCDAKHYCTYKVSTEYLAGAADQVAKPFAIQYKCGAVAKTATTKVGTDSEGQVLRLLCPRLPLTAAKMTALFAGRTTLFRQILKNPVAGKAMAAELGASCTTAINELTAQGKTLRSSVLESVIYPLSLIKFPSGVADSTFWHYTNSPEAVAQFVGANKESTNAIAFARKTGAFEKMMKFLRTRELAVDNHHGSELWRRVFYVAEDPASSATYGKFKIKFELSPDARTISYVPKTWVSAINEVVEKYPSLKVCHTRIDQQFATPYATVWWNSLFLMIAEDSGVEVMDYGTSQRWFQVLSSTPFTSVSWMNPELVP